MLYPDIEKHVQTIIELEVPIVFTSAGNPKIWTKHLQEHGIVVVHVVSSVKFALKAEAAGVDALVVEGFEAGGHNGRDETTTLCLIPLVVQQVNIPVLAAGGVGSGHSMLACMVLGADGVQMGSRFVASEESSAHIGFKNAVIESQEGDTMLTLKELTPVRLIKNEFYARIEAKYHEGASIEELKSLLGRGRAKKGMFEGDLKEGELEIGQVSGTLNEIKPAGEIVEAVMQEFYLAREEIIAENRFKI
jgi:enoyl-[acyl-carrier protein] reductase II